MSAVVRLALDGGHPHLANTTFALPPTGWVSDIPFADALRQGTDTRRAGSVRPSAEPQARRLERAWRHSTGAAHVVACRSGAVAARLALAALEIVPGDEVICPADSFLLTFAHAAANRATVVFADLDPRSLHLDPEAVEAAITPRTRAIVAVDRHGATGDYRRLRLLAEQHGLVIVEDATASVGAVFDNIPVGALGSVSFCALGEGGTSLGVAGLFATDDEIIAAKARRVMLVDDDLDSPGFDLESGVVGGSYRLADLDALLASAELAALGDDAPTRIANGNHLRRYLDRLAGIRVPEIVAGATNVYTSFPLVVVPDELGLPEEASSALRDTLIDCMAAEGLRLDRWRARALAVGGPGGHAVDPALDPVCHRSSFPVAENAWAGGLVLAGRPALGPPSSEVEMDAVVDCFVKVLVDNVDRLRQLTVERRDSALLS